MGSSCQGCVQGLQGAGGGKRACLEKLGKGRGGLWNEKGWPKDKNALAGLGDRWGGAGTRMGPCLSTQRLGMDQGQLVFVTC